MFPAKLLTTEQVSELLQVHPFTVLKYIKEGKLKGIKLGRVWRIRESDVEKFLEDRSMALQRTDIKKDMKEPDDKPDTEVQNKKLPNDQSDHYIL